ncbi:NitT/TauT family transport system ATP-binding protein OS=Streptomyces violarus OX=67380 GN=FHS41_001626 PE=4 SV=1 [Streptomyces violarus]
MAFVFQEYGRSLFPWMRVGENVELPLRQRTWARHGAGNWSATRWSRWGWRTPWGRIPGSCPAVCSSGSPSPGRWRTTRVLLMDEPFAAVDAQTRADLEDLVRGLWRERGITILFVTHDIDEAVYLGERVIVLSASPTVVREHLKVDLPVERDQLHTRVDPRFAELRTHVYEQIQAAKKGVVAS